MKTRSSLEKTSQSKERQFLKLWYLMLFLIFLAAIVMLANNIYYIKTGEVINSKVIYCNWYCSETCNWYPTVLFQDSNGRDVVSNVSFSYSPLNDCPKKIADNLSIRYVKTRDNVLMASENITNKVIIFVSIGVLMALLVYFARRFISKKQNRS